MPSPAPSADREGDRGRSAQRRANPSERHYEAERFNDAYDIFALSKWAGWQPWGAAEIRKQQWASVLPWWSGAEGPTPSSPRQMPLEIMIMIMIGQQGGVGARSENRGLYCPGVIRESI